MSHITLSNYGSTPFEKLMGYAPKILNQWQQLELEFSQSKTFDPEFLEQVRRALAFNNLCQYCMAKAGPPDENPNTVRLSEALRFANRFAIDHTSISKKDIERMQLHFLDYELIELIAYCSFITASQKFGACLGLETAENYKKT